jgi:hypothetical protein
MSAKTLTQHLRKYICDHRWPLSRELWPLKAILAKLGLPKPKVPPTKCYAPPRGTAKQRHSFEKYVKSQGMEAPAKRRPPVAYYLTNQLLKPPDAG